MPLHVTDLLCALSEMSGPPSVGECEPTDVRWPSFTGPIAVGSLDSAGWAALGLTPRRAGGAVRFADAIGGIRSIEDLRRMRSLPAGWLDHFQDQLRFPTVPASPEPLEERRVPQRLERSHPEEQTSADLNHADSLELLAIKGVGPWVAGRILRYRERHGGFASCDQLVEAFNGWDSLAQALQPLFHCRAEDVVKRCADTLTEEHWRALPGVGFRQSKALERLVRHHGGSAEVLWTSPVLDSAQWRLVMCYLEPCTGGGGAE